jgi:hypothetical protein
VVTNLIDVECRAHALLGEVGEYLDGGSGVTDDQAAGVKGDLGSSFRAVLEGVGVRPH